MPDVRDKGTWERPRRIRDGESLRLSFEVRVPCPGGCGELVGDIFQGLRLGKQSEFWLWCPVCDREVDVMVRPATLGDPALGEQGAIPF